MSISFGTGFGMQSTGASKPIGFGYYVGFGYLVGFGGAAPYAGFGAAYQPTGFGAAAYYPTGFGFGNQNIQPAPYTSANPPAFGFYAAAPQGFGTAADGNQPKPAAYPQAGFGFGAGAQQTQSKFGFGATSTAPVTQPAAGALYTVPAAFNAVSTKPAFSVPATVGDYQKSAIESTKPAFSLPEQSTKPAFGFGATAPAKTEPAKQTAGFYQALPETKPAAQAVLQSAFSTYYAPTAEYPNAKPAGISFASQPDKKEEAKPFGFGADTKPAFSLDKPFAQAFAQPSTLPSAGTKPAFGNLMAAAYPTNTQTEKAKFQAVTITTPPQQPTLPVYGAKPTAVKPQQHSQVYVVVNIPDYIPSSSESSSSSSSSSVRPDRKTAAHAASSELSQMRITNMLNSVVGQSNNYEYLRLASQLADMRAQLNLIYNQLDEMARDRDNTLLQAYMKDALQYEKEPGFYQFALIGLAIMCIFMGLKILLGKR